MRSHRIPALLAGLVFAIAAPAACAHEFSDQNLFLAYVKLISPQDMAPYNEVFAETFAPKTSGSAGEFEVFNQKANAAKILAANVAAFDISEPFILPLEASFGQYDFTKQAFEFRPISAATAYRSSRWLGSLGTLEVVFVNTKGFADLPMAPDAAKAFVDGKSSYQRNVAIDVEFVPNTAMEGSGRIRATVRRIDVYADSSRRKVIATLVAKS